MISKLQEKVDSQCTENFDCSLETDCTSIERPEKPEGGWWIMSEEDKAEMELKKEAFEEQVVFCGCCEQKSVGELLSVEVGEDGSYDSSSSHDGSEGHHGGGHEGFISKLQEMADSECSTSDIACDQSTVNCANIEKPGKDHDHSDWMNMSDEDKAAAKAEMQAMKEEFKEKVVYCVCCKDMSIQDLLASNDADEYGEAASTAELAISKALAAVDGSDPSKSNPASSPASLSWAWALVITAFIGTSMTL